MTLSSRTVACTPSLEMMKLEEEGGGDMAADASEVSLWIQPMCGVAAEQNP